MVEQKTFPGALYWHDLSHTIPVNSQHIFHHFITLSIVMLLKFDIIINNDYTLRVHPIWKMVYSQTHLCHMSCI